MSFFLIRFLTNFKKTFSVLEVYRCLEQKNILKPKIAKISEPTFTLIFYKNNFIRIHEAHFCSKFKNKLRTIQPQQKYSLKF